MSAPSPKASANQSWADLFARRPAVLPRRRMEALVSAAIGAHHGDHDAAYQAVAEVIDTLAEPVGRASVERGTTRAADPGRPDVSSAGGLGGGRHG